MQAGIGLRGGGFNIAGVGHFQRAKLQAAALRPGDVACPAMHDLGGNLPALQRCAAVAGQGNVQVARVIVTWGCTITKAEHRQGARGGEGVGQRHIAKFDMQRGGRGSGGKWEYGHQGAHDTAPPCYPHCTACPPPSARAGDSGPR